MSGKRKRPSGQPTEYSGVVEEHEHYVSHWRRVWHGDRDSARYLLETFCVAVDSQDGAPGPVLAYVRSAIARYLRDGTPLEKAFGLALPRGRRKGIHGHANPLDLAALFYLYRSRDGMGSVRATKRVARERGIEPRTVERAVRDHPELKQLVTAELEALVEPTPATTDKKSAISRR